MTDIPSANLSVKPFIPAHLSPPEITVKAIIIAIVITAILGASNAYLALKMGTTIAAAIPAAVMALAVLRWFKKHHVLEINLIQTSASAGEGVAAAVSFVLPSLVIIGYWQHFPYWVTVFLIAVGGVLGVLLSVPIRRVMLYNLNLPFPEGTAIGNVLKASASGKAQTQKLFLGGIVGGAISFLQDGFQVVSENMQIWFISGKTWVWGNALGFSPALIAAGYIVGAATAVTLLIGVIVGWGITLPLLGYWHGIPIADTPYEAAMTVWSNHLRYVGVGTMLVGGLWTLITLIKPIYSGIVRPMQSWRTSSTQSVGQFIPRTERDIPMKYIFWGTLLLVIIIYFMLVHAAHSAAFIYPLGNHRYSVGVIGAFYVLIGGFFLASICAYMSGLVGMTNTPLSGLLLITVLLISLFLLPVFKLATNLIDPPDVNAAIAIVMLITTLVAVISAISGENLQDLKAGQIIGATPWKQQVMLLVGVGVSALLISPVLELLFQAYGMGGVFPRPGMSQTQMLQAPQASLIAAVAKGIFGQSLSWHDITVGIIIGIVGVVADELLRRKGKRLPVLAVGLAIYLPPEVLMPIIIGGLVKGGVEFKRRRQERRDKTPQSTSDESANLLACGLVAGSALMGIILAIPFVMEGSSDALKLVSESFTSIANGLGIVVMVLLCVWLYKTGTAWGSSSKGERV